MNNWLAEIESVMRWVELWVDTNQAGLIATVILIVSLSTTGHILLHKRDSRAAATWVGLVWLAPIIGAIFYFMLGVNRIRRRAKSLTGGELDAVGSWRAAAEPSHNFPHWDGMTQLTTELSGRPLTEGNDVTPLQPPEALQSMLNAINQAQQSVYLSTYIFGNDAAGKSLINALVNAAKREVDVYVLIDGVGSLYSLPPVVGKLRRGGVKVARFLYSLAPWKMPYINMRNHRKLMVVDRREGFMGGMNIREGYIAIPPSITDAHFRVRGPVIRHLLHSFASDWQFVTEELLDDSYAGAARVGDVLCRGISAGPDADFDKRRMLLLAAIGRADYSIRIVTPYFIPDQALQAALQLAALRGVKVDIILPFKNNLPVVHWAALHSIKWLLKEGVSVYLSQPPFDHSKLMTIDGIWSLVGSGNWDARSLRLNFEYDMESYSRPLTAEINSMIDAKLENAHPLGYRELVDQPLLVRLRNALAHLLAPYL